MRWAQRPSDTMGAPSHAVTGTLTANLQAANTSARYTHPAQVGACNVMQRACDASTADAALV